MITATDYRYGYQGQYAEKDPETDWNAFELRMYNAKIARWLSVDPEGEFWSPYVAMGNDPGNTVDPTGGETGDGICPGPGCLPEIIIKASPMNNYSYRHWASIIDAKYKGLDYSKVYDALLEGGVGARALNTFSLAWSATDFRERYSALTDASREAQIFLLKEGATFVAGGIAGKLVIKGAIWGYRAYNVHRYGRILASSSEIATVTVQSTEAAAVAAKGVSAGENALVKTFQCDIPGHGAERLLQRGISEKMAQTAIRKGSKFFDPKNGTINYILEGGFGSGKDLLIGTNPINGAIKTGIRGTNLVRPRMIPIQ